MNFTKLLILFLLPIFFTGCINYTELNELGIIESIGIDKDDNNYFVSVTMIDAKKENDDSDELRISYDVTGKTITEAIQNLYLKSNKKIYLSHVETLLLSEDVAKDDTKNLVDFFLRNQQSRNAFTTLIVKGGKTSDIIHDTEKNPEINDIVTINQQEYGITSKVTFEDLSRMLLEDGIDAVLPTIKLEDNRLEIDGYAYFKKNSLSSYLSKEESITYNLLKNLNSHIVLTHSCDNKFTNIKLEELNTTYKSKKQKIIINTTGTISITENNCNLKEKQILTTFEKKLKENIQHLLKKQKNNSFDILGMQSIVRQNDYSYFQKYKNNLLNDLVYQINVTLTYNDISNLEGVSDTYAKK